MHVCVFIYLLIPSVSGFSYQSLCDLIFTSLLKKSLF